MSATFIPKQPLKDSLQHFHGHNAVHVARIDGIVKAYFGFSPAFAVAALNGYFGRDSLGISEYSLGPDARPQKEAEPVLAGRDPAATAVDAPPHGSVMKNGVTRRSARQQSLMMRAAWKRVCLIVIFLIASFLMVFHQNVSTLTYWEMITTAWDVTEPKSN